MASLVPSSILVIIIAIISLQSDEAVEITPSPSLVTTANNTTFAANSTSSLTNTTLINNKTASYATSSILPTTTPATTNTPSSSINNTTNDTNTTVTALTVLPTSSVLTTLDGCPMACSCTDCKDSLGSHAMKCVVQDLQQITGKQMTSNLEACSLDLAKGNISTLERGIIQNFNFLQQLFLSYNNLSRILDATFINASYLQELYLDHNKITKIDLKAFIGLDNLITLNLDYNSIVQLDQGCFVGLNSLQNLSLRYNKLKKWNAFLLQDAPKVLYLYLKGNTKFTTKKKLLRNTTVQLVDQVSISKTCRLCQLKRKNASLEYLLPTDRCQYIPDYLWPVVHEIHSRFVLFEGFCSGNKKCDYVLTSMSKITKATKDYCWEVLYDIRYFEYVLGVVAIATNIAVVLATLLIKPLRETTAFALVGHMAFCDVLLGTYALAVAYAHYFGLDNMKLFRNFRQEMCPYFRTIFTLGTFMEVATSLLVTIERYLAIVFCMKRWIRLSKTIAAACLLVFWGVAAVMCVVMQIYDRAKITDNLMCILVRDFAWKSEMYISQGIMIFQVFLYLVVVGLYIHIYIYVRRSQRNAGVKRESKLARRIGVLVFSNFLFFVVPNLSIFIITSGTIYFDTNSIINSMIRRWLPPMCLVFNACLNPFLFAFRNESFTTALNKQFRRHVGQGRPRTTTNATKSTAATRSRANTNASNNVMPGSTLENVAAATTSAGGRKVTNLDNKNNSRERGYTASNNSVEPKFQENMNEFQESKEATNLEKVALRDRFRKPSSNSVSPEPVSPNNSIEPEFQENMNKFQENKGATSRSNDEKVATHDKFRKPSSNSVSPEPVPAVESTTEEERKRHANELGLINSAFQKP